MQADLAGRIIFLSGFSAQQHPIIVSVTEIQADANCYGKNFAADNGGCTAWEVGRTPSASFVRERSPPDPIR